SAIVSDHDMIDRPLLGAGAGKTNNKRHLQSFLTLLIVDHFFFPKPGGRPPGNPGNFPPRPGRPGVFGSFGMVRGSPGMPGGNCPPGMFFAISARFSGDGMARAIPMS